MARESLEQGRTWRKHYEFTPNSGTERVIKPRPEYPNKNIEKLTIEKNGCVRHILDSIELTYGKDPENWTHIRKIILRSINDYHRLALEIIDQEEDTYKGYD